MQAVLMATKRKKSEIRPSGQIFVPISTILNTASAPQKYRSHVI
jgi:hypothetical protein